MHRVGKLDGRSAPPKRIAAVFAACLTKIGTHAHPRNSKLVDSCASWLDRFRLSKESLPVGFALQEVRRLEDSAGADSSGRGFEADGRAWRIVSGGGAGSRIRTLPADVRYGCEESGSAALERCLQLAGQARCFGEQAAFRARWPAPAAVFRKVRLGRGASVPELGGQASRFRPGASHFLSGRQRDKPSKQDIQPIDCFR